MNLWQNLKVTLGVFTSMYVEWNLVWFFFLIPLTIHGFYLKTPTTYQNIYCEML